MLVDEQLKSMVANPHLRRPALVQLAERLKDLVLDAGAEPGTAYLVAGEFVKGVAKLYEEKEQAEGAQFRRRVRRGPYRPREEKQ